MTPEDIAKQMDKDEVVVSEAREGFETRTYTITSRPHNLDRLEKLLGWANHLGRIGHSGAARLEVDGDGSGQTDIERTDGKRKKIEKPDDYDGEKQSSEGRFEYSVGLD